MLKKLAILLGILFILASIFTKQNITLADSNCSDDDDYYDYHEIEDDYEINTNDNNGN